MFKSNFLAIPIEEVSTEDDASSGRGNEHYLPIDKSSLTFISKNGEVIVNDKHENKYT